MTSVGWNTAASQTAAHCDTGPMLPSALNLLPNSQRTPAGQLGAGLLGAAASVVAPHEPHKHRGITPYPLTEALCLDGGKCKGPTFILQARFDPSPFFCLQIFCNQQHPMARLRSQCWEPLASPQSRHGSCSTARAQSMLWKVCLLAVIAHSVLGNLCGFEV